MEPYGTPVVEGELVSEEGELASEKEERAASEEWCRLWTAMSVRRLARRREAIEEGRASPPCSMISGAAVNEEGPGSVRTRFNAGLQTVRAAVEDEGLEAVRARFFGACRLQAGESPDLAPLSPVAMRQTEAWVAPETPLTPLDDMGELLAAVGTGASDDSEGGRLMLQQEQQKIDEVEAEARACDGVSSWYRRRDSVNSWYMLTR